MPQKKIPTAKRKMLFARVDAELHEETKKCMKKSGHPDLSSYVREAVLEKNHKTNPNTKGRT
jgi:hypothetical protein